MRVLVLGGDGYLGWPTALPARPPATRSAWSTTSSAATTTTSSDVEPGADRVARGPGSRPGASSPAGTIGVYIGDLTDADVRHARRHRRFAPDAVVHFAEQRAAPYSMIDRKHAVYTQDEQHRRHPQRDVRDRRDRPDIHLVKLGTMGEYGTPNIDIEEGWLEVEHKGRKDRVLYPKRPGSFYHLSKVHDSHNLEFGCRIWGLRATDLNQGVVYGQETEQTALDPRLATRFDYDAVFGTVLNRFAIQAVARPPADGLRRRHPDPRHPRHPRHRRCIGLACENPADPGEFRVFNQATEPFSVQEIAQRVARLRPGRIEHCDNPRVEQEHHYYRFAHTGCSSRWAWSRTCSATPSCSRCWRSPTGTATGSTLRSSRPSLAGA